MVGSTLRGDDKEEIVLGLLSTGTGIGKDNINEIHSRRLECSKPIAAIKAKVQRTYMKSRWESSLRERWTFHLAPYIIPWMKNKHCELNYYVTQFLIGHGCFRKYLHRFGYDSSPTWPNCVDEE